MLILAILANSNSCCCMFFSALKILCNAKQHSESVYIHRYLHQVMETAELARKYSESVVMELYSVVKKTISEPTGKNCNFCKFSFSPCCCYCCFLPILYLFRQSKSSQYMYFFNALHKCTVYVFSCNRMKLVHRYQ